MTDLMDAYRGSRAVVHPGRFAVVKADGGAPAEALAVIRAGGETTWVVDEQRLPERGTLAVELGWRLITFDMVLPFGLVGFLAAVAGALARDGISLFALSAYSTDHILVRDFDLTRAEASLSGLGFVVRRAEGGDLG
jgi:hypothetical protein